jgi:hypothetical protein
VRLDSPGRRLTVVDTFPVAAAVPIQVSWHLGPEVAIDLDGFRAALSWQSGPNARQGSMLLPEGLNWSTQHAEVDPIEGWYAPRFGTRVPATSLIGRGIATSSTRLLTELELP